MTAGDREICRSTVFATAGAIRPCRPTHAEDEVHTRIVVKHRRALNVTAALERKKVSFKFKFKFDFYLKSHPLPVPIGTIVRMRSNAVACDERGFLVFRAPHKMAAGSRSLAPHR